MTDKSHHLIIGISDAVQKFLRFGLVGILNTGLDMAILSVLLRLNPTHKASQLILYNTLAYAIGACNSFILNKKWTFNFHEHIALSHILKFILATGCGIVMNDLVLLLLAHLFPSLLLTNIGLQFLKIGAIMGNLCLSFFTLQNLVFVKPATNRSNPLETPPSQPSLPYPCSLSLLITGQGETLKQHAKQLLPPLLQTLVTDFEIITVSTPSPEASTTRRGRSGHPYLQQINRSSNLDAATTLSKGIQAAQKDFICIIDVDDQFAIEELMKFLPLVQQSDILLGYRKDRHASPRQLLQAWLWKILVRFVFGINVRDINCGFKLYRTECLQDLHLETHEKMLPTEILYKCIRRGYSYAEVGITHTHPASQQPAQGSSTNIFKALYELFTYSQHWRIEEMKGTTQH